MQSGKERSPRHHLRISSDGQNGGLLLANPMACGNTSEVASSTVGTVSQQLGGAGGPITRTNERGSFKKSRPKSPSLLRFFVRGGGSKKQSVEADEEDLGSSGSDHEDPFSPKATTDKTLPDLIHANRHTEPRPGRSDGTSDGLHKRRHTAHRDSGFGSERDSVSRTEEHDGRLPSIDDTSPLSSPLEEYRPRGMEALEMLHNQLQILVKSECPQGGEEEETDIQSQIILSLRQQLEDMHQSVDCLRQSDQNLRLSLRMAEQRALEAEAKLAHSMNRSARVEQLCAQLSVKYQVLSRKHRELERIQQRQAVLQEMERVSRNQSSPKLPHRVHSQREFDRRILPEAAHLRPSSAQDIHNPVTPTPPLGYQGSLTETCV